MGVLRYFLVGFLLFGSGFSVQFKELSMKTFKFNLDLPPQERWTEIITYYKPSIPLIIDYFKEMVPNKEIQKIAELLMTDLDGYFGELGQEMRGIASAAGIDLGIVVGLNVAYELRRLGGGHPHTTDNSTLGGMGLFTMGCTSIVAQDKAGKIYHGRNLDWNFPNNLRNTSIQIDYYRGNQLLFKGITSPGYVGILTGISPHGFSVSINERDLGGYILVNAMDGFLQHAACPSHLLREVFVNATSYEDALLALSHVPIIAPVYYIIAGSSPNQGAVLSRDRNSLRDLWSLKVSPDIPNSWYLLETNYDHWKPVKSYDNRRYYGNQYMQALGQEKASTFNGLLSVLTTWPVQNNFTFYTTLMYPEQYLMKGYCVIME